MQQNWTASTRSNKFKELMFQKLYIEKAHFSHQFEYKITELTFMHCQLLQQLVILHYVAGHFPKLPQISILFIDMDFSTHTF